MVMTYQRIGDPSSSFTLHLSKLVFSNRLRQPSLYLKEDPKNLIETEEVLVCVVK